jgi:DegV family protein with EDD domain
MNQVAIITDSSSALPLDVISNYDIKIAALGYVFNNKVYRDNIDIKTEDFWKLFPTFKEIPTTSAVSLGDFRNIYLDLAQKTRSIVCITMSTILSATNKAAEQAAQIVMEEKPGLDIRVIDCQTGLSAMGLIVIEAARAAKAGKSLDEVVQVVQDMLPRAKYFMILESLKYIMKVGRAPDARAQNAQAPAAIPAISPIMGIIKPKTGVLENLDRAGNIDEALVKAANMVKNYIDVNKEVHFLLAYSDRMEKIDRVKEILSSQYKCAEILTGPMTPSMIVSCGPMYSIGFYT